MASYHSSFTYLNKNSSGEGFIIASFEPDSGFVDTYLNMDQITTDSYDGAKKFLYGNRYNSQATISVTLIKPDGTAFSEAENRLILKWLSGSRQASWLDFYVSDTLAYSFLGNFTSFQQQKQDAKVIGIQATFTSINPWAWSASQNIVCGFQEEMLEISEDGILYRNSLESSNLGLDENGVLYNDRLEENMPFSINEYGIIFNEGDNEVVVIDNLSDDLYTYTNLNVTCFNQKGGEFVLENQTLGEKTIVSGLSDNEEVVLAAGQFIISSIPNKVFGNDFNFVWPRLCPGVNKLTIGGGSVGTAQFAYRYPMKVGDCAMDVENLGLNPMCEGKISGAIGSADGVTFIGRENITLTDVSTMKPYEVSVVDGYLSFDIADETNNHDSFALFNTGSENGTMNDILIKNSYMYFSRGYKSNSKNARECLVFVDENTNLPYKIIAQGDSLYISQI